MFIITDNQSLNANGTYAAYTHTVVYTCCFEVNAIMNCLAEKSTSQLPCAPVQQGQGGSRPASPAVQAHMIQLSGFFRILDIATQ